MTRVLLNALADELMKAVDVIRNVDEASYRVVSQCTGSIGGQFRHNFDLALCLLKGFTHGRIDYSDRERDPRIESDRMYAAECFKDMADRIRGVVPDWLPADVRVRSEAVPDVWFRSETSREIEFVYSHTIHHHALIAEKLSSLGLVVPDGLGVAPSTLQYWKQAA